MMFRTRSGQFKRVGYYEPERTPKTWHRYADVFVPMITLPLICVIGLYLHLYMTDSKGASGDEYRSEIFALSSALLIISFIVFVYICIRLSAVLGGRTRLRLPMIRSNRSHACFMKPVNSELEFMTPFNNHPLTYESIIFDLPPYPKTTEKSGGQLPRINSDEGLTI